MQLFQLKFYQHWWTMRFLSLSVRLYSSMCIPLLCFQWHAINSFPSPCRHCGVAFLTARRTESPGSQGEIGKHLLNAKSC